MLIDYQNLSNEAKVFLYPSSRKLYDNEVEEIRLKIKGVISEWSDFSLAFKIEYNRFLLFFISEESIVTTDFLDRLAHFILQLEKEYSVTLLDKVNVCFKQGAYVQYQEMKRFRELVKKKSISKKTIIFNNLIRTKHEFENEWEVPLSESWLSYLIAGR